jgi:hypothetical protein
METKMIKVENDMLVLDNTFTKEDVKAIDEFVKINVDKERKRIIKLLEQHYLETRIEADIRGQIITQSYSIDLITLIKGENK